MSNRHRSSGGYTAGGDLFYQDNWGKNTPVLSYQDYDLRSMDDVVVPDFARLKSKGQVFFNPMTKWHITRTFSKSGVAVFYSPGLYKYYHEYYPSVGWAYNENAVWSWTYHGCMVAQFLSNGIADPSVHLAYGLFSESQISALCQESATACHAERGTASKSNSWESLAEIHKTISMLRHPIKTFMSFDKKFLKRVAGTASQSWLAYRYGIKPLVMNVDEVVNNLSKIKGSQRIASRDSRNLKSTRTTTRTVQQGIARYTIETTTSHEVKVRSMSLDEANLTGSDYSGMSGKQLLQLPWELVPYSFVVDWFVNVGDYISANLPTIGWKNLGSCQTVEHVITTQDTITSIEIVAGYSNPGTYNDYTWNGGGVGSSRVLNCTYKTRTTLPSPSLTLTPVLRGGLTRIADGLSLVAQAVMKQGRTMSRLKK